MTFCEKIKESSGSGPICLVTPEVAQLQHSSHISAINVSFCHPKFQTVILQCWSNLSIHNIYCASVHPERGIATLLLFLTFLPFLPYFLGDFFLIQIEGLKLEGVMVLCSCLLRQICGTGLYK